MGRAQELSEFQHGIVIGCHLYNKSSCEISLLLNIPQSTVSGIITKWRQLSMTATQSRSSRPCKMMERGQLMHRVHRGHQLSAGSIATDLQTSCCLQISSRTLHRELHGMGFHGQAAASKSYISKCNAKRWMQWWQRPLDSRAVETHSLEWRIALLHLAIWWTSLGLVVARRMLLVWHCIVPSVKFGGGGIYGTGLFFRSRAWPFGSTPNASAYQGMLDNSIPLNLVGTGFLGTDFEDGFFVFWHDCAPVHKARSIKTWMREFGVDELDWPAQNPDLNPIKHL